MRTLLQPSTLFGRDSSISRAFAHPLTTPLLLVALAALTWRLRTGPLEPLSLGFSLVFAVVTPIAFLIGLTYLIAASFSVPEGVKKIFHREGLVLVMGLVMLASSAQMNKRMPVTDETISACSAKLRSADSLRGLAQFIEANPSATREAFVLECNARVEAEATSVMVNSRAELLSRYGSKP